MSDWSTADLVRFVKREFKRLADPVKAPPMQAYMKTDMPFYGIQKPDRVPVYREMKKRFPVQSRKMYREAILALWNLNHREEKYAAINVALTWPKFIDKTSIPTYRKLIVEGAWWDFVDSIAVDLVGAAHLADPKNIWPTIDSWIDHKDMWLRRTAIICQIKHKEQTDRKRLFEFCLRRADETEFFIRKAIGWALRAHSYTEPEAVRDFLLTNQDRLSGLSFREGAKQLKRIGMI